MVYKTLVFVVALFQLFFGFSQIKGKCLDLEGKPIPYVNVTVKGKKIGTVSNLEGKFSLKDTKITNKDTLLFSHIQFVSKKIQVGNFNKKISLQENTEELDEIFISSKKQKVKEKIVGTKTTSSRVVLSFTSKNLGTEIGKIIRVKRKREYHIKEVSFNIGDFNCKSATFRINFYKIKKEYIKPEKEKIADNIIKVDKEGLVTVNFSNQELFFKDDFLVAIEWIDFETNNKGDYKNPKMYFSSTVFSGPFIFRSNPNLKWNTKKQKFNVGVGIFLKVDSYKIY